MGELFVQQPISKETIRTATLINLFLTDSAEILKVFKALLERTFQTGAIKICLHTSDSSRKIAGMRLAKHHSI